VDWDKSATLGLLLVRELVEGQLEGNIQLERKAGAFWKITWSTPECESQREQDDE
jgi:two-component sensor histidine kinase